MKKIDKIDKIVKRLSKHSSSLFKQPKRSLFIQSYNSKHTGKKILEWGNFYGKGDGTKVFLNHKLLGEALARTNTYCKKLQGKKRKALDVRAVLKYFEPVINDKMTLQEGFEAIAHHTDSLVRALRESLLPHADQVETVGEKYKKYEQICKSKNQEPLPLKEFKGKVIEEAALQGINIESKEFDDNSVVLLTNSVKIGPYTYGASQYILNEQNYRDVNRNACKIEVYEPFPLFRIDGKKGIDYFNSNGSKGVFWFKGVPVSNIEPGAKINPLDASLIIAMGLGARKDLFNKPLVMKAHDAKIKQQKGEKLNLEEEEALKTWESKYHSNNDYDKVYIFEGHLKKGDIVSNGSAVSPGGNPTNEFYLIKIKGQINFKPFEHGAELGIYTEKDGFFSVTIDDNAKCHDYKVMPFTQQVNFNTNNTRIMADSSEVLEMMDAYKDELKKLEEKQATGDKSLGL